MTTEYLELNSKYRDRTLYPNAADFSTQTGGEDPVFLSSIIKRWKWPASSLVQIIRGGLTSYIKTSSGIVPAIGAELYQDEYQYRIQLWQRGNAANEFYITLDAKIKPGSASLNFVQGPTWFLIPGGPPVPNYYAGYYLCNDNTGECVPVLEYDAMRRSARADLVASAVNLRRVPPPEFGPAAAETKAIFHLKPKTVATPGDLLYLPALEEYKRILVVDADAGKCTTADFSTAPPPETTYELWPRSYDNAHPLDYSGNPDVGRAGVFYNVSLIRLYLPVASINYPYVYVELSTPNSLQGSGSITSNNPAAHTAVFHALFEKEHEGYRYYTAKYEQTLNLTVGDEARLKVTTPGGKLITLPTEIYSPGAPEDYAQIIALFSLEKGLP